jgi:hypothetical protein
MNDLLFNILVFAITFGAVAIYRFAIPGLSNWLKTSKYKTAYFWIEKAVKAAEKIYKEAGMGIYKKEYVINFIGMLNKKLNLKLTNEQIEILIEACCQELNDSSFGATWVNGTIKETDKDVE